jgi:hypothetical protein
MLVRVRTRIKSLKGLKVGEVIETNPLLNTGYAGSSPEIIVPFKYMKEKARGSLHRNILIHCYWTVDDRKVHNRQGRNSITLKSSWKRS